MTDDAEGGQKVSTTTRSVPTFDEITEELAPYVDDESTPSLTAIVRMHKLMYENPYKASRVMHYVTNGIKRKILIIVRNNGASTYDDLASVDCSRKTIQRHVKTMEDDDVLRRVHDQKTFIDFYNDETKILTNEFLSIWNEAHFGQR